MPQLHLPLFHMGELAKVQRASLLDTKCGADLLQGDALGGLRCEHASEQVLACWGQLQSTRRAFLDQRHMQLVLLTHVEHQNCKWLE